MYFLPSYQKKTSEKKEGLGIEFSSSANENSKKILPTSLLVPNIFIKLFHFPILYEKLCTQREKKGKKKRDT
jgi:hypothetical protein